MLIRKNRLFAYPVLNDLNKNYKKGKFSAKLIDKSFGDYYVFDCHCELENNKSIEALINESKCLYTCLVECGKTKYRYLYSSKTPIFEIKIKKTELCGHVEFSINIVATKKIQNFSSPDLGEDYSGRLINFDEGSFIAIGPQLSENFPMLNDSTFGKNNSFIKIQRCVDPDSSMSVDWNDNNIIIYLFNDIYQSYLKYKDHKNVFNLLIQMIVVPALMDVFSKIGSELNHDLISPDSTKWYQTIDRQYKKERSNRCLKDDIESDSSCLTIVQDILKQPLRCAVNSLDDLLISFEGEDMNE